MKNATFFLLLLSATACQNHSKLLSKVEGLLADNPEFSGVVLLSEADQIIFSSAKGFSEIEAQTPLKASDLFVIGSISKQMTAVMILNELEKGHLKLEDTVGKYLPSLLQNWSNEVTIHHLLAHTHGITSLDDSLNFAVGQQFQYSQLGYELLANILEAVHGTNFQNISMAFFKSHDLHHTFHPIDSTYKNLVRGYQTTENGTAKYETNSLNNYVPAGAFISNAEDLAKWNTLLHSGKLVKMETLDLMKTRYATRQHPIFGEVEYGYGLLFKAGEADLQIGALGYAPAFASASYYHPKSKLSLVVLSNKDRFTEDFKDIFEVHTALMDLVKLP